MDTIGKRIAQLRQENNWTQQYLADRIAISRVAISHIEMDLSLPGERTITLLAGLFKLSPIELVMDTTYPQAKGDRLPLIACCYTKLEVDLLCIEYDLHWLKRFEEKTEYESIQCELWNKWYPILENWIKEEVNQSMKTILEEKKSYLWEMCHSKV